MKKLTAIAVILICAACGKDNSDNNPAQQAEQLKALKVTATIEGGAFKDAVADIGILDYSKNYPLRIVNGAGSIDIPENVQYIRAQYPYDENAFLSSEGITLTIPSAQKACTDTDDASLCMAIGESEYFADGVSLNLFRIGGCISFTIEDEDVSSITFSSANGSDVLAGSCFARLEGGAPKLVFMDRKSSISVLNGGQAFEKDATYYLFCAPAELKEGATMTLKYANGDIRMQRLEGPLSIPRGGTLDLGGIRLGDIKKTPVFDDTQIVTSLAAISDTHIGNGYGSESKFTKALRQLGSQASANDPDGLDGVLIVGDVTDANSANQAWSLKNLYEEVYSPTDIPMVYTIGNHDIMNPLMSVLGEEYLRTDVGTKDMRENHECRHNVIGGVHVLGIAPNHYGATTYDDTAKKWLDDTLAELTAAEPEKYVLVLTHPMIYDTCYGSLLGPYWYTTQLTTILKKYPQAVTFGGHLHFPINDPRSIWQGDFTSMGCGSVSYMAIEDGKYEYMKSNTVMKDAGDISSGLLLQFDASGNMRITRMFFSGNAQFGEPWEISYPTEDKSHLAKYSFAARSAANSAPELSTLEANVSGTTATAVWAAGADDEFVHHYVISLYKDGTLVQTKKILADFYRHAKSSGMKAQWSEAFTGLSAGSYEFRLTAIDSWDASSAILKRSFSM